MVIDKHHSRNVDAIDVHECVALGDMSCDQVERTVFWIFVLTLTSSRTRPTRPKTSLGVPNFLDEAGAQRRGRAEARGW